MSDKSIVWMVWVGFSVILLALFPPGRALMTFALGQAWRFVIWSGHLLLAWGQAVGLEVWRAHGTLLRNLGPRQWVLPSVGEKTTRRD